MSDVAVRSDHDVDGDDFGGRIVVVIDLAVAPKVEGAGAELAAALAERVGMPVTLTTVPTRCLDAVRVVLGGAEEGRRREFTPPPRPLARAMMAAAPFVWRDDGRPDWGAMWTTFCELALYGGPPHRGPDNPLRAPERADEADGDVVAEIRRGIWETTGLYAEPAEPGWLAVTCDSRRMAAWMCAAIILENVDAEVDEDRLRLPAGPGYQLKDEVKSIVTVVAKTHHYWQAHIAGDGDPRDASGGD